MTIHQPNLPLTGLGVSGFERLGLEDFFPKYNVISLTDPSWVSLFPELAEKVFNVNYFDPNWHANHKKLSAQESLDDIDWKKVKEHIDIQNLLIYKPVANQEDFSKKYNINVLTNSYSLFTQLENKVNSRKLLSSIVPFPRFKTIATSDLQTLDFGGLFKTFGKFVIQDAVLSSGRGTIFVDSLETFASAISYLTHRGSQSVVISQYIQGRSASVQVCVTRYGVFSLPPQRQIINQSLLTNAQKDGSDKFNGAQWSDDDFSPQEVREVKEIALKVGTLVQSLGYKGIFGIDFIVEDSGHVNVLEVNARLTGVTAVLTHIQKSFHQIPLLLLHTLEHLQADYSLTPKEISELQHYDFGKQDFSYLLLFNNNESPMEIQNSINPGIYQYDSKSHVLDFKKLSYSIKDLQEKGALLLIDFPKVGSTLYPDERLGKCIIHQKVLDSSDNLTEHANEVIRAVRSLL